MRCFSGVASELAVHPEQLSDNQGTWTHVERTTNCPFLLGIRLVIGKLK